MLVSSVLVCVCLVGSALATTTSAPPYASPTAGNPKGSFGYKKALPGGMTPGGSTTNFSMTVSGTSRWYMVHVPSSHNINNAAPLIIAYHGKGEHPANIKGETQLSNAAYSPYGVTVFPNGLTQEWQGEPDILPDSSGWRDDFLFTNMVSDAMEASFCIDTGREFAMGMTNGGGFTGSLACNATINSRFAVFGANSAAVYTSTPGIDSACNAQTVDTIPINTLIGFCSPGHALPILEVHGLADTQIVYSGGQHRGYFIPYIPHWVQAW